MDTGVDLAAYGEAVSSVHDQLYPPTEVPDIVAFLSGIAPPPARVVEFGVGTGRLAIPLAEHGHEVSGLDASPAMLEVLRARDASMMVEASLGDFTTDVVGTDFDVCLIANSTLFMVTTQRGQRDALTCAARHLRPGGALVLELYEPSWYHSLTRPTNQTSVLAPDRLLVDSIECDPVKQLVVQLRTLVTSGRVSTFPEVSRYSWPAELDVMADSAGLTFEGRWADWRRSPFDRSAVRHISLYRRST